MSLQVWLPLNSNLKNQGLDGSIPALNCSSALFENGKIGNCLHVSNYATSTVTFPSLQKLTTWSFTCWLKINTSEITTVGYQRILSLGSNNDGNTTGIRIEHANGAGKFQIIINKAENHGNNTVSYYGLGNFSEYANSWVHIAVTNDGENIKTYINGSLIYTHKVSNIYDNGYLTGEMSIGAGNCYCYINDLRIYDEAISSKLVSEIAKGLVIHFPLKTQYEIGIQNKYSGEIAEGNPKSKSTNITITKLSDERGYNYKINYTGTGTSTWINFDFGNFSFTPGKTYFYSCKVRCHSANFNIHLRASRSDNDWVTNTKNVLVADGQWHEYYVYQTVNETYVRSSNETVTCNPVLEFYTDNLSTADKVYSANFDIKDIQVVESDCYVPFINNDFTSTIVADCSGYLNNGTASGNLLYNLGSPRYESCYKFSGNSSISSIPQILNSTSTDFTISCWCNFSNNTSTQTVYTSRTGTGQGVALFLIGGKFRLDDGSQAVFSSYSVPANTWLHLCVTRSSTDKKLYINGELISTITSIGDMSNIGKGSIGGSSVTNGQANSNYTSGLLSDFRLYVTALELSEIQKLYNSPISVDKSGNMYACELKEV